MFSQLFTLDVSSGNPPPPRWAAGIALALVLATSAVIAFAIDTAGPEPRAHEPAALFHITPRNV